MIAQIKNLTKKFASFTAVDDISFDINEGEILGLLGPNGAGKTTTVSMILGILQPTQGSLKIFDMDISKFRSQISEQIGFSAVYAHLPANLTIWQNLYVFGLLYNLKNLKEKINSLIEEFDLVKFVNTKAGLLSSGELSRLNLAKALINKPKLLLLDEPTASLDPNVARIIREKIKNYSQENGAAVLWTSHNMKEIEDVCDQVLFISQGKISLSGNPKTLPAKYGKKDLEELFISIANEPLYYEK